MVGKIFDDPDKVVDGSEKLAGATSTDNYGILISSIATYLRSLAQTLTNKTIDLASNTITGTTAQFNTALSDGSFATLAGTEELTGKTVNAAVAKGTWTVSGTWTIPAVTLGGTVSGGGNQINNVVIGTSTPLAGSFTTLDASTSLTTPIHKSAAAIDFQTNGSTYAGNITTGQQWYLGSTKLAPPTGPIATISKNAAVLPAIGTPAGVGGTAQCVMTLGGVDATAAELFLQSFGTGKAAGIRYFQADGTAASRTATTAGTIAANFAYGYTGSVYVAAAGFIMQAMETYSGSVSGCRMDIYATPTGSTGGAIGASVGAGLMVGTTTDRGAGTINMTGGLFHGSFTVGTLPAGVAAGNTAYASNARVFNGTGTQEGAGAGTGGLVNYNGSAWKLAGTNTTAIA